MFVDSLNTHNIKTIGWEGDLAVVDIYIIS